MRRLKLPCPRPRPVTGGRDSMTLARPGPSGHGKQAAVGGGQWVVSRVSLRSFESREMDNWGRRALWRKYKIGTNCKTRDHPTKIALDTAGRFWETPASISSALGPLAPDLSPQTVCRRVLAMKIARILSAGAALALLIVVQPALAEEGWLQKVNPFAKKENRNPNSIGRYNGRRRAEPSPLEKLDAGTKKFFAGARDALTWKKPAPKRKPTSQYVPWIPQPQDPRYLSSRKKKKKSWLDSLFRREEPKQPQSLKDWVGLPRLAP